MSLLGRPRRRLGPSPGEVGASVLPCLGERNLQLFYDELADGWPLISPVEDCAGETEELVRERHPSARTRLELGSGGGTSPIT